MFILIQPRPQGVLHEDPGDEVDPNPQKYIFSVKLVVSNAVIVFRNKLPYQHYMENNGHFGKDCLFTEVLLAGGRFVTYL